MSLTISIDGVDFTLIRKTIYDDRYRDVVNVESLVVDDDEQKSYNFWVYRSNSELGLWRLCVELRGKFHKGPDYIQSTLIHIELQNFINDNIDFIPFVSNNVRLKLCSYKKSIIDVIDDKEEREVYEEPFITLDNLDKKSSRPRIGCGHIPKSYSDSDINNVLQVFSNEFERLYEIKNVEKIISNYDFVFEESLFIQGVIFCVHLTRKTPLKRSRTNSIKLYFMAAKLENIDTMNPIYETAKRDICNKAIHVFPFLLIPEDSGVNQYGCYTSYIPSGIYICKLFDYHTLMTHFQCTLEEIESKKCNNFYSYIGERYDHLFPFEEALITYRNKCILPGRVSSPRASPRRTKTDSYSGEGVFREVSSTRRKSSSNPKARESDEMITIKFSGGKTKKNNISAEELRKCDKFCNGTYLEKKKQTLKNFFSKNYYKKLNKKEMNEKMNNIDKSKIISDCKQMYCNPKCSHIRKNLPERYTCCKGQSEKAKN
jgi:hypothetical protein